MTTKSKAHAEYTELTSDQVRQTLKDAIRHYELGHLNATLQLELAQATEDPEAHHITVAERQVRDYEAQLDLLRKKFAALPGE